MNEILLFILSIFFGAFIYQLQKWLSKPSKPQFERMRFSLWSGYHTEVMFIREKGKIIAFPTGNADLVLKEGIPEAIKAFEKKMKGE